MFAVAVEANLDHLCEVTDPPPQPLRRYRAEQLRDLRKEGRWGVFNVEADRWLDVHFGSEAEATQAASFLCRVRRG